MSSLSHLQTLPLHEVENIVDYVAVNIRLEHDVMHHDIEPRVMTVEPMYVYSGIYRILLSRVQFDGCSFPLARTLEVCFNINPDNKDVKPVPSNVEVNVSAFVQSIRQMAPRLNMVKLSGDLDSRMQPYSTIPHFDSLATQLVQLGSRIELSCGFKRTSHFLQIDSIRHLTYLHTTFDTDIAQTIQLIRQNAPTLTHLSMVSNHRTDLSDIINDTGTGYVKYPHLHTLLIKHDVGWATLRRLSFEDGMVPFPNLRRLVSEIGCPFGDGMTLFRGNAATLELLKLTLTHELAVLLIRENVFTPTSHPKLQYVIFRLSDELESVNYANDPAIVRLMLEIAPGATVRGISDWDFDKTYLPPVISLLSKHNCLQVLALSDLSLSIWDAMAMIRSLPLLSDFHAVTPTLYPMPEDVSKRDLVNYVCSNYSPMGTRFRCWHIEGDGVVNVDGVIPFLLLALACPNFDYAALLYFGRERFAEMLKRATSMAAFQRHAHRLRRLLPLIVDKE
ncbi:hypothetical protein IW146_001269 [Coemansia sp. RSA 922]|nr:hypothetical protein IW146_001269 [Coemansia sp. RSA 922]